MGRRLHNRSAQRLVPSAQSGQTEGCTPPLDAGDVERQAGAHFDLRIELPMPWRCARSFGGEATDKAARRAASMANSRTCLHLDMEVPHCLLCKLGRPSPWHDRPTVRGTEVK